MKHYIGISLVLVVLAAIALFFMAECRRSVQTAADSVRDAVASALRVQPEVRINQRVIYGQTAPVAELAVLSQEELVELNQQERTQIWGLSIPFSQTQTRLGATFRIKAGFDLRDRFVVRLAEYGGDVDVSLPPARILSVELAGPVSWQEQENWLNGITAEERQEALNMLMESARESALQSGILQQAEAQARDRLRDVLQAAGHDQARLEVRPVPEGGAAPD